MLTLYVLICTCACESEEKTARVRQHKQCRHWQIGWSPYKPTHLTTNMQVAKWIVDVHVLILIISCMFGENPFLFRRPWTQTERAECLQAEWREGRVSAYVYMVIHFMSGKWRRRQSEVGMNERAASVPVLSKSWWLLLCVYAHCVFLPNPNQHSLLLM